MSELRKGDICKHHYAGHVQVVEVVDDRYCKVNVIGFDQLRHEASRVIEEDKLSAISNMTLIPAPTKEQAK